MENNIEWSPNLMVEVKLSNPDNFLKVRETLTRIGVCSRNENKLFQSCHILHKQGTYFIVHFLELFALDGKRKTISKSDFQRRNRIIKLLSDWGLVEVVNPSEIEDMCPMSHVKVISFKDKEQYQLISKYTIGNYKK